MEDGFILRVILESDDKNFIFVKCSCLLAISIVGPGIQFCRSR